LKNLQFRSAGITTGTGASWIWLEERLSGRSSAGASVRGESRSRCGFILRFWKPRQEKQNHKETKDGIFHAASPNKSCRAKQTQTIGLK
jgi:hypothetical protein